MAEFEITTIGEVKMAGEVVARITWLRPFIETEIEGVYAVGDECFAPHWGCVGCGEREEEIDELKDEIAALKKALVAAKKGAVAS